MKKDKSLKEISKLIDDFCEEREWQRQRPNSLISSIIIELGELAEHYQWKEDYEDWDEDRKREVGYEFVDVLFYFLELASNSGIDLEKYFDEKLPKLAAKYPPKAQTKLGEEDYKRIKEEYRRTGKNKLYE